MLKIINDKNTFLNKINEYFIKNFNISIKIFYGNIHIFGNGKWAIIEKRNSNFIVIINNGFFEDDLGKINLVLNMYMKKTFLDFFYFNIISYLSINDIYKLPSLFKIELNRKYYNINNKYFIEKNKVLNHLYKNGELDFSFISEGFEDIEEKFLRKFNFLDEEKFLFIDYKVFFKKNKFILKGIFNRFLDIINVFDGYNLFKKFGLNVPNNYLFLVKEIKSNFYFFSGFSFLELNNFKLVDLYGKKELILGEIHKLNNQFCGYKTCNLLDINQILNTIPGNCKLLKNFNNLELYFGYSYYNLDICHFLYKKDKIYIIDYNKILFAPMFIYFLYELLFFISVDYLLYNVLNIDTNIVSIKKYHIKYIKKDLKLINKDILGDILISLINGMELDLGEGINYEKLRKKLLENKDLFLDNIYKFIF